MTKAPAIRILTIRDQRVVIDFDFATIYGTSTAAFNQAITRNSRRFPVDFSFVITREELDALISQNVISKPARGGRTKLPRVFTEHGALMAASILTSDRATAMSIYVIRAFVEMREHLLTNSTILKRLAEVDKTLLLHDSALRDIYQKLVPLLAPPPAPPKRRIGFQP